MQTDRKNRFIGLILIISSSVLWGISGPAMQWLFLHETVDLTALLAVRLFWSGMFMLLFLAARKENIWAVLKHWKSVLLFGILGILGLQYTFISAIEAGNAVTATLFQFLAPIFITVYIALKVKQAPAKVEVLAILIGLAGIYFVITNGSWNTLSFSAAAVFWGIATALAFSFYSLYPPARLKGLKSSVVSGWGMLVSGFLLFIVHPSWKNYEEILNWDSFSLALVVFLTLFGTCIPFFLFMESLKFLSPTEVSILSSVEPLMAVIVSVTWLLEPFGLYQIVGSVLIIITAVLLSTPKKEPASSGVSPGKAG
ncbi:MAG TPA: EamA family transporter [Bacillus sp. (in: firmicutes)]|nr:EamA family transporter [Bacillus sp. (in: firmicutes)]